MQRILLLIAATALLAGCETYDNGGMGGTGQQTQIQSGQAGYAGYYDEYGMYHTTTGPPRPGNALDFDVGSGMTVTPGAHRSFYPPNFPE